MVGHEFFKKILIDHMLRQSLIECRDRLELKILFSNNGIYLTDLEIDEFKTRFCRTESGFDQDSLTISQLDNIAGGVPENIEAHVKNSQNNSQNNSAGRTVLISAASRLVSGVLLSNFIVAKTVAEMAASEQAKAEENTTVPGEKEPISNDSPKWKSFEAPEALEYVDKVGEKSLVQVTEPPNSKEFQNDGKNDNYRPLDKIDQRVVNTVIPRGKEEWEEFRKFSLSLRNYAVQEKKTGVANNADPIEKGTQAHDNFEKTYHSEANMDRIRTSLHNERFVGRKTSEDAQLVQPMNFASIKGKNTEERLEFDLGSEKYDDIKIELLFSDLETLKDEDRNEMVWFWNTNKQVLFPSLEGKSTEDVVKFANDRSFFNLAYLEKPDLRDMSEEARMNYFNENELYNLAIASPELKDKSEKARMNYFNEKGYYNLAVESPSLKEKTEIGRIEYFNENRYYNLAAESSLLKEKKSTRKRMKFFNANGFYNLAVESPLLKDKSEKARMNYFNEKGYYNLAVESPSLKDKSGEERIKFFNANSLYNLAVELPSLKRKSEEERIEKFNENGYYNLAVMSKLFKGKSEEERIKFFIDKGFNKLACKEFSNILKDANREQVDGCYQLIVTLLSAGNLTEQVGIDYCWNLFDIIVRLRQLEAEISTERYKEIFKLCKQHKCAFFEFIDESFIDNASENEFLAMCALVIEPKTNKMNEAVDLALAWFNFSICFDMPKLAKEVIEKDLEEIRSKTPGIDEKDIKDIKNRCLSSVIIICAEKLHNNEECQCLKQEALKNFFDTIGINSENIISVIQGLSEYDSQLVWICKQISGLPALNICRVLKKPTQVLKDYLNSSYGNEEKKNIGKEILSTFKEYRKLNLQLQREEVLVDRSRSSLIVINQEFNSKRKKMQRLINDYGMVFTEDPSFKEVMYHFNQPYRDGVNKCVEHYLYNVINMRFSWSIRGFFRSVIVYFRAKMDLSIINGRDSFEASRVVQRRLPQVIKNLPETTWGSKDLYARLGAYLGISKFEDFKMFLLNKIYFDKLDAVRKDAIFATMPRNFSDFFFEKGNVGNTFDEFSTKILDYFKLLSGEIGIPDEMQLPNFIQEKMNDLKLQFSELDSSIGNVLSAFSTKFLTLILECSGELIAYKICLDHGISNLPSGIRTYERLVGHLFGISIGNIYFTQYVKYPFDNSVWGGVKHRCDAAQKLVKHAKLICPGSFDDEEINLYNILTKDNYKFLKILGMDEYDGLGERGINSTDGTHPYFLLAQKRGVLLSIGNSLGWFTDGTTVNWENFVRKFNEKFNINLEFIKVSKNITKKEGKGSLDPIPYGIEEQMATLLLEKMDEYGGVVKDSMKHLYSLLSFETQANILKSIENQANNCSEIRGWYDENFEKFFSNTRTPDHELADRINATRILDPEVSQQDLVSLITDFVERVEPNRPNTPENFEKYILPFLKQKSREGIEPFVTAAGVAENDLALLFDYGLATQEQFKEYVKENGLRNLLENGAITQRQFNKFIENENFEKLLNDGMIPKEIYNEWAAGKTAKTDPMVKALNGYLEYKDNKISSSIIEQGLKCYTGDGRKQQIIERFQYRFDMYRLYIAENGLNDEEFKKLGLKLGLVSQEQVSKVFTNVNSFFDYLIPESLQDEFKDENDNDNYSLNKVYEFTSTIFYESAVAFSFGILSGGGIMVDTLNSCLEFNKVCGELGLPGYKVSDFFKVDSSGPSQSCVVGFDMSNTVCEGWNHEGDKSRENIKKFYKWYLNLHINFCRDLEVEFTHVFWLLRDGTIQKKLAISSDESFFPRGITSSNTFMEYRDFVKRAKIMKFFNVEEWNADLLNTIKGRLELEEELPLEVVGKERKKCKYGNIADSCEDFIIMKIIINSENLGVEDFTELKELFCLLPYKMQAEVILKVREQSDEKKNILLSWFLETVHTPLALNITGYEQIVDVGTAVKLLRANQLNVDFDILAYANWVASWHANIYHDQNEQLQKVGIIAEADEENYTYSFKHYVQEEGGEKA